MLRKYTNINTACLNPSLAQISALRPQGNIKDNCLRFGLERYVTKSSFRNLSSSLTVFVVFILSHNSFMGHTYLKIYFGPMEI